MKVGDLVYTARKDVSTALIVGLIHGGGADTPILAVMRNKKLEILLATPDDVLGLAEIPETLVRMRAFLLEVNADAAVDASYLQSRANSG